MIALIVCLFEVIGLRKVIRVEYCYKIRNQCVSKAVCTIWIKMESKIIDVQIDHRTSFID